MDKISRRSLLTISAFAAAETATHMGSAFARATPEGSSQLSAPKLIVRGDDMGYAHAGIEAIVRCHNAGIMKSVEVLAPSPWFPEAVKALNANPSIDVGVHLALSSEWDNVKWRPLTDCPSLRDKDGYFYPQIKRNKNYPKLALAENVWRIQEIEKEFRAQIELVRSHVPQVSHYSTHMGCAEISDDVRALARALGQEYAIGIEPQELGVTNVSYIGPHVTPNEKVDNFLKMLSTLQRGKTYLFVDHPGLDTDELRGIHHIGYEDVAADRQGVTELFTSERVREFIHANEFQLIAYKDLKNS